VIAMNRLETIITVDTAAIRLEQVMEALATMCATHSMVSRVENLVRMLDDLRVDIGQCDLLNEPE
jgi:glutamate mutase epsilon subunit